MSLMDNALSEIARRAESVEPDDYFENGLRMCGKCRTPKEAYNEKMGRTVPVMCKCRQKRVEANDARTKEAERRCRINEARRRCFHTAAEAGSTFDKDDRSNTRISDAMRQYAEYFEDWRRKNVGLLLHGPVGTGKTFFAACIANYLIDNGYTAEMTSFTRIVNTVQSLHEERQEYIDDLMRLDLLIIDDLGVERDSEYMREQVTAIIDARYKSGKPLIVTTNIPLEEIKHPADLACRRMYDRILEICHPVKVDGKSRRRSAVARKYHERNVLLGLEDKQ